MQINVKMDTSGLDKAAARYQKNLAYSTAQALNDVALEAQRRLRDRLPTIFHLRKPEFMRRSIKIFAFAKVSLNRAYAEIGIDNKARLILSLFEQGGKRQAFKGRNVAVPLTGRAARPSSSSSVPENMTFQALAFQRGPITKHGKQTLAARRAAGNRKRKLAGQYYVWQGNDRTFILTHTRKAPLGGVFKRTGPTRDDVELIYAFKQQVPVRPVLGFKATAHVTFDDLYRSAFYRRFYRLT